MAPISGYQRPVDPGGPKAWLGPEKKKTNELVKVDIPKT